MFICGHSHGPEPTGLDSSVCCLRTVLILFQKLLKWGPIWCPKTAPKLLRRLLRAKDHGIGRCSGRGRLGGGCTWPLCLVRAARRGSGLGRLGGGCILRFFDWQTPVKSSVKYMHLLMPNHTLFQTEECLLQICELLIGFLPEAGGARVDGRNLVGYKSTRMLSISCPEQPPTSPTRGRGFMMV